MRRAPILLMLAASILPGGPPLAAERFPIANGPAGAAATPSIFRFSVGPAGHRPFQPLCVGTFLEPGLAITAAHCLRGAEPAITLACQTAAGKRCIQTVGVLAQAQHPTHDVTLLHLASASECAALSATIASVIEEKDRLFIASPPGSGSAAGALGNSHRATDLAATRLNDAVHGLHTIEVTSEGASPNRCLARGDSGAPLLLATAGGNGVPTGWSLAGLLIAGAATCPGEQVFVRLDQIRDWIEAARTKSK